MTIQRRTGFRGALSTLLALLSVTVLCAAMAPAPAINTVSVTAKATTVSKMGTVLLATVIVVPPTQVVNPLTGVKDDQTGVMVGLLNGWVADQTDDDLSNVQYVRYPQSVWWLTGPGDPTADESRDIGAAELNRLIETATANSQTVVVVGYSQGASVNTRWLQWYKEGKISNPPDPANVSFVNVGNPNRPNGGPAERFAGLYIPIFGVSFDGATPSDTPYQVTEVAHEYDGISDFPVYVWNLPAVANAFMGMAFVHAFYDQVDLNDPNNIVTHDGNLTDVLVHTPVLPLMQPLYIAAHLAGRTETPVLDAISVPLRVIIDAGYDRTTAEATPANFGNPFQNLDTAALKAALDQSADILFHGAPGPTSSRTFTQFPDLQEVVKVLTTSPLDTAALNKAAVRSAEDYLYGTPKAPEVTPPPAAKEPEPEGAPESESETRTVSQPEDEDTVSDADAQPEVKKPVKPVKSPGLIPKLPKLPKLPSIGGKQTDVSDTAQKTTKPGWKPGDGLKRVLKKVHEATHGNTVSSSDSPKVGKPSGKPDKSDNSSDKSGDSGS